MALSLNMKIQPSGANSSNALGRVVAMDEAVSRDRRELEAQSESIVRKSVCRITTKRLPCTSEEQYLARKQNNFSTTRASRNLPTLHRMSTTKFDD
ncbi:hypothetical protein C2E31_13410 [Rhodopirellula baltica]|nr:hypothetical protein C2E31_13410 [Rhodopirellula baltica]